MRMSLVQQKFGHKLKYWSSLNLDLMMALDGALHNQKCC